MKVHRAWLQTYFDAELPSTDSLAELLTSRAFEIEETKGDMLDVKVLPDRAAYALSHRGIAKELSAILNTPLKVDPLRTPLPTFQTTKELSIVTDPAYVRRHTGALIRGVKVGPSPAWLTDALESVGQRSINNVVDIMNYVMLNIGQPAGAFDLGALRSEGSQYKIEVRRAHAGERITVLTGEEYTLTDQMFVFIDAISGTLLDIAGVKGGKSSGITEHTTDIFLSVGCYNPVLLRRTAQTLKLFTDASLRYQNAPSPELTMYGMRDIVSLITDIAGGTLVEVIDEYHQRSENPSVEVTKDEINARLGTAYSTSDITSVLDRLGLTYSEAEATYTVTAPFERTDITIPEDVAEEVGRIMGYENLEPKFFPVAESTGEQYEYRGVERIRDTFIDLGYLELSTQSFAKVGEVRLANPLDVDNPYLRMSLIPNMQKALKDATYTAPLVLAPNQKPKLFEIGGVFSKGQETRMLAVSEPHATLDALIGAPTKKEGVIAEYDLAKLDLVALGKDYVPKHFSMSAFTPFSPYPFVLRDIALWVPEGTKEGEVAEVVTHVAGPLLHSCRVFDTFAKAGRVSYAFRLVFQSMERTLTDVEVTERMGEVTQAVQAKGWEVR